MNKSNCLVAALAASFLAWSVPARSEDTSTVQAPGAPDAQSSTRTLGWAAIGASGLLLGTSVYAGHRVWDVNHDAGFVAYRDSLPAGQSACDAAASGHYSDEMIASSPGQVSDMCTSAKRWQTVSYVAGGTGLAALVTGIVILATSGEAEESKRDAPPVQVVPTVAEGSGSLRVELTF